MEKLLRIGIPTYNRSDCILHILQYMKSELNSFIEQQVEIIVADNSENDDTKLSIINFMKDNSWIIYYKNKTNIGATLNVSNLILSSNAKYTWIVCDDDILVPGLLNKIISILKNNIDLSLIFINHDAYNIKNGEVLMKYAFSEKPAYNSNGKDVVTSIFLESGTSLMFATASILSTRHLKYIINKKQLNSPQMPLDYMFYCASKGPVYILNEVLIHNSWGDASWLNESIQIMYYGVLRIIEGLSDYSYSKKQIRKMAQFVIFNSQVLQMKMILFDKGFSVRLFKYYNLQLMISLFKIIFCKLLFFLTMFYRKLVR